jgi:pyridoxamine 5'-phosphate oxidase
LTVSAARLDSLQAIEAALWRELAAAPRDKAHPWRTPVLASTDGDIGDARTVVLRGVDGAQRRLLFYSDARAAKAAQLAAHPRGTLVFWSGALGWQLRLRVACALHSDGLEVSSHWERLKLTAAAQDYLSALAPGSTLDADTGARGERDHFALIEAAVQSTDWLELHPQGHRRARFDAAGARWLQP